MVKYTLFANNIYSTSVKKCLSIKLRLNYKNLTGEHDNKNHCAKYRELKQTIKESLQHKKCVTIRSNITNNKTKYERLTFMQDKVKIKEKLHLT